MTLILKVIRKSIFIKFQPRNAKIKKGVFTNAPIKLPLTFAILTTVHYPKFYVRLDLHRKACQISYKFSKCYNFDIKQNLNNEIQQYSHPSKKSSATSCLIKN